MQPIFFSPHPRLPQYILETFLFSGVSRSSSQIVLIFTEFYTNTRHCRTNGKWNGRHCWPSTTTKGQKFLVITLKRLELDKNLRLLCQHSTLKLNRMWEYWWLILCIRLKTWTWRDLVWFSMVNFLNLWYQLFAIMPNIAAKILSSRLKVSKLWSTRLIDFFSAQVTRVLEISALLLPGRLYVRHLTFMFRRSYLLAPLKYDIRAI